MSIETNLENLKNSLNKCILNNEANLKNLKNAFNNCIECITPPAATTPPPAPVTPAQLIMTAAANGMTYDQYITAGWTDEQMITSGIATAAAPAPPAVTVTPDAPPPAVTVTPAPVAMTPEELNTILIAEFNRLGDRVPIDTVFKEFGATGAKDLPAEKYQALIDKVKAIPKAV